MRSFQKIINTFFFIFIALNILQAQEPEQESPLVPFTNGINFGFRDSITKKIRIMPVYNGVSFFYGRFAKVKVNNKWGVINKKGETILETKYDSLFILKNNIFLCYQSSKCFLVNHLGENIGVYDNLLIFEDNDSRLVARDMIESTNSFFGNSVLYIANNGGYYMKVVKTDTTLVKYSDGMSSKLIREKRTFPYVEGGKFGLLNDKCEALSAINADSVKIFMKVYKNVDGKEILQEIVLIDVGDNKAMTKFEKRFIDLSKPVYLKEDGIWKIMDVKNKSILETKFQTIRKNRDKLFAIINNKQVQINEEGDIIEDRKQ